MALTLEQLPIEILLDISLQYLDYEDNCNLRLTSKRLASAATSALFSHVTLFNHCRSLGGNEEQETARNDGIERQQEIHENAKSNFAHILSVPEIASCIHAIDIRTQSTDDINSWSYKINNAILDKAFAESLQKIPQFPNLTALSLLFTNKIKLSPFKETAAFHSEMMQLLLQALASDSIRVSTLRIQHMLPLPYEDLIEPGSLDVILGRLSKLHLRITVNTQSSEYSPKEQRNFYEKLPSIWLQIPSQRLTHLSLFCDESMAHAFVISELRNIHIPNLQMLALGDFYFTHDWKLDWILSHSATLEQLYLWRCHIVYYVINPAEADSSDEVTTGSDGEPLRRRHYGRRWYHYFNAFQNLGLKEFRFGSSHSYPDYFESPQYIPFTLPIDRYMSGGIPDSDPNPPEYPHCEPQDRAALFALMGSMGAQEPFIMIDEDDDDDDEEFDDEEYYEDYYDEEFDIDDVDEHVWDEYEGDGAFTGSDLEDNEFGWDG